MAQSRVSFTFFGPVDGLECLTIPKLSVPNLYKLPAIESTYEFAEGGVALMVARVLNPESQLPITWVGSYKQTYEKDLQRRGHSFGVGLWFSKEIPRNAEWILQALHTLRDALTLDCFRDGHFCDRGSFHNFVFKEFEPNLEKFCAMEFPEWQTINYGTGLSLNANKTAFQAISKIENASNLKRLLEWSIWSPGATGFHKSIFAEQTSGTPIAEIVTVENLAQYSGIAYLQVVKRNQDLDLKMKDYKNQIDSIGNDKLKVENELTIANDNLTKNERQLAVERDKVKRLEHDPNTKQFAPATNLNSTAARISLSSASENDLKRFADSTNNVVQVAKELMISLTGLKKQELTRTDRVKEVLKYVMYVILILIVIFLAWWVPLFIKSTNQGLENTTQRLKGIDEKIESIVAKKESSLERDSDSSVSGNPKSDITPLKTKVQGK